MGTGVATVLYGTLKPPAQCIGAASGTSLFQEEG